eukprot:SAG31_NODE_5094_length_2747_cov_1.641616_3_plen_68_part_00
MELIRQHDAPIFRIVTVDEAAETRDLASEEAMTEFGVKNKKHAKKLSKLAKSKAKAKKAKNKGKADL